jgi:hypothetical protein
MVGAARNHQTTSVSEAACRRSTDSAKSRSLKRESSFVRQKSNLALTASSRDRAAPAASGSTAVRQPTTPSHRLPEAAKKSTVIHNGPSVTPPPGSPRKALPTVADRGKVVEMAAGRVLSSVSERTAVSPLVLSSGTFNRRLTATLSPEECKMMFTHTEKVFCVLPNFFVF